ncbi:type II toxin-antitoxin system PemK/MazF family toxin [Haloimpatiens massiliensis]|uniref:type II toxin-antitoxin system PemK/MazF family toxin n=1 Tax=Haloimpatiens massiliensis TaxID=1658110 RepID=UPI0015E06FE2|nr:type II toxin-antitoxin system PemK/MazF family toxin [Haloimpatiens massiliensis]
MKIKRGQLVWVNFESGNGSCQKGKRPAVIVQNNTGNRFSTTTIVLPITSKNKNKMPVHTALSQEYNIAAKGNIIMAEQLTIIDKSQILNSGDMLSEHDMKEVERIILKQLSLKTNIA